METPRARDGDREPDRRRRFDRLEVGVYRTRLSMGQAAARAVADRLRILLAEKRRVAMVFAAAPSQEEFLATLATEPSLDWERVVAFHLDEYVGLAPSAPQGFGSFLRMRLFARVRPGTVQYLNGNAADLSAECARYARLLADDPLDVACIGIGENGHVAFNDPPVADFDDPRVVKVVELDPICRAQQVHDGCFAHLEEVPTRALTLTVPAIFGATWVHCIVPASSKARAVHDTLLGPVDTSCPASILRRHERATLYLDRDSAAEVPSLA